MEYDVFLSHSSKDRADVDRVRDELKALGYRVCVDYEVLPTITSEEVTRDAADALLEKMRECSSLVYVLSPGSTSSQWMPWEMGFFDGANGTVFIWPVDEEAEAYAKERRYVDLYPKVPSTERKAYLEKHLPRELSPSVVACPLVAPADFQPPPPLLFGFGQQQATAGFGQRLPSMMLDPTQATQAATEILYAWWRLWGLMPPPQRPGGED